MLLQAADWPRSREVVGGLQQGSLNFPFGPPEVAENQWKAPVI